MKAGEASDPAERPDRNSAAADGAVAETAASTSVTAPGLDLSDGESPPSAKAEARSDAPAGEIQVDTSAAWQEISRLGLVETLEHDARPSIIIDLSAVDTAHGQWGRVYTNAAYDATPASDLWSKFERRDGKRIYTGPPDLVDWVYGPAPFPDPDPIVHSNIWIVSRLTLRSRWRIISATRRDPPPEQNESGIAAFVSDAIPSTALRDDFSAAVGPGSATPRSWSRASDVTRSLSGTKSPFYNMVHSLPLHPMLKGVDWSNCALGHPDAWPIWRRQLVSMLMVDLDPGIVIWKDRTVLYNELVIPIIAQKHPAALGSDASVSFAELWALLEPLIESVYKTKKSRRLESLSLPMARRGYLEETFWTFTLTPIYNDDGEIEAVYERLIEVTASVLAARRMEHIAQINETMAQATKTSEVWDKLAEVMVSQPGDSPYALLFSAETDDGQALPYSRNTLQKDQYQFRFKGSVGKGEQLDVLKKNFDLADQDNCLAALARQAFDEHKALIMRTSDNTLPDEFHFAIKDRGFGDVINSLAIHPVMPVAGKPMGVIFKALNPRKLIDADYHWYVRVVQRRVNEAFASLLLPIEERKYRAEVQKAAMDHANLAQQLMVRTKEAEHSAAAFTRLAENAPIGMFMYSADGYPVYVNDYYLELTGLSREDFDQFMWLEGVHPEERDRLAMYWDQLYNAKMPVTFEFRMNRPYMTTDQDGREVAGEAWALTSSFPQLDEEGGIINVIGWQIDISPQKWAQAVQRERLKDALESRSQAHRFIDMVSHECRNPLSAILQSADGILTAVEPWKKTSEEDLNTMKDSIESIADSAQTIVLCAQHQKRIVDDILTVSKLDGNHLIITPDKADPVALVEHVLKMYEAELVSDSISTEILVLEGYKSLEIDFVLLDPSRVLQILINLITNAIKFTAPQKKRRITIRIDASLKRPAEGLNGATLIPQRSARLSPATTHPEWNTGKDVFIQFCVQDTGRGMSPEEMDKLFERFAQASPRTHVKYGGSGLGLFISRELTELQGGQVSVSSTLGLGSTFAFFVNARRSTDPARNSQTPVYTPGPASNGSSDHPHSPAFPFPHVAGNGIAAVQAPTSNPTSNSMSKPTGFFGSSSTTPMQSPLPHSTAGLQPPAAVPTATSAATTEVVPETLHVLVVEDNLINQKVMAKQLQRKGCVVHVANHGEEALSFLRRSEYARSTSEASAEFERLDVILMDIEMPVMDGITCVREIRAMQRRRELHGHVPVIAVTANARDAQQAEARKVGMDNIVTKPFRIPDLIPKMESLVGEVRRKRPH